jgi:glycosyltransferase involved in cell wall biosynthesis
MAIADIEATEPLPEIWLAPDEDGLALLVRVRDRPTFFTMHTCLPGARLDSNELGRIIAATGASELLRESLRRELTTAPSLRPLERLTVAVCTRSRPRSLRACLTSLVALQPEDRADPRAFELLVVDNAPPDNETRDLVRDFGDVRYVCEPRPGLDFARNRALREATGRWLAFVDDDAVVDRGWRNGLEEAISEQPDAVVVTGLVLPLELRTRAQIVFELRGGFRRGFRKLRYHGRRLPGNRLYPLGAGIFGAGCNMAMQREPVIELGGFDEALDTGPPLPGGGDLDLFYRVARAGKPLVYEPRMLVFHRHRRGLAELRGQYRSWGEGFMAFVSKTRKAEPDERQKARAMVAWWFAHQLRELRASVAADTPQAPDLVLAELLGGVRGLTGSYRRSQVRSLQIREKYV